MRKLFYEVSTRFKPTHYLVMARIHGEFEPMTFDSVSGSFCQSYPSGDPQRTEEAAEVYDKETAIVLLGHDALNSKSDKELKLFPVYVQEPPQLYMIFAQHADDQNELPSPLCRGNCSPLTWATTNGDTPGARPELFDLKSANELVERQTILQTSLPEGDYTTDIYKMFIIPVNVSVSGKHDSPYLNPATSAEPVADVIRECADYCRSLNPDEEDDAWHMPASLGGGTVVPEVTSQPITSPENPVQ